LQRVRGEARRISYAQVTSTRGRKAQAIDRDNPGSEGADWRCLLSAAPILACVWAAALPRPVPKAGNARPIETLAFYRKHTEALLREYMQKSMEMGRTPSILGNCVFRGKVSSYRLHTFEDTVIFVFDIEKGLKRLDKFSQDLVARITLQEYSQGETAALTGQPLRSIVRKYAEAIDTLTGIFLEYELLNVNPEKSCQGGKIR
jgi:hypothetical protein